VASEAERGGNKRKKSPGGRSGGGAIRAVEVDTNTRVGTEGGKSGREGEYDAAWTGNGG